MHALRSYPSYRESGVSWLGKVPTHWEIRRIKNWLAVNQSVLPEDTDPDYAFDYLEIGSIGTGRIVEAPETVRFEDSPSRARRIVKSGDTIVSTVRTYLKAVWHADHPNSDLVASTGFAVLTPRSGAYPKFVSYLCQSEDFTNRVVGESVGVAYPAIAEAKLANFHVGVPPVPEQSAIVCFLDHADRRIRRSIRINEKLIALLEEQKRAVIHEAVTGRIDVRTGRPYPAYKPYGVEGLGDAPEHWDIVRLSRLIRSGPKNGISPLADEHGAVTSFAISAVRNGIVDVRDSDRKTVSGDGVAVGAYNLLADDILLVRGNGNLRLVGRAGLVERDMPGWIYPDLLMRLRLTDRAVPRFVVALLNLPAARSQVESSARTAVGTFKINSQHVRQLLLALPDIPEQLRILAHVSERIRPLVERESQATRSVELMRQFRSRLIADVVTGKLDVREAATALLEESDDPTAAKTDCAEPEGGDDSYPTATGGQKYWPHKGR